MNKENKVTSKKLSKKIHDKAKEKGFELPESEYYWYRFLKDEDFEIFKQTDIINNLVPKKETYPAYDYKEIFDILNIDIPLDKITELAIMDIVNNNKNICENNGKILKATKDIIKSIITEKLNDWVEE